MDGCVEREPLATSAAAIQVALRGVLGDERRVLRGGDAAPLPAQARARREHREARSIGKEGVEVRARLATLCLVRRFGIVWGLLGVLHLLADAHSLTALWLLLSEPSPALSLAIGDPHEHFAALLR